MITCACVCARVYFFSFSTDVSLKLLTVKYTPQWTWLKDELQRVDREKTPWLIVLMHAPIYNSNMAHYMEGESMRSVFERWFVHHKVDLVFAGHVHAYERSVCFVFIYFMTSWLEKSADFDGDLFKGFHLTPCGSH